MELSKKLEYKKKLILMIIKKQRTTRDVAIETGKTIRCIQKWVKAYKEKGEASLIHGNTGKKRIIKEREEIKKQIINIFLNTKINNKNPFENITYSYFTVVLKEFYNINVSVTWVKKILNSIGYKTVIKHKIKKKETHLMRERMKKTGELIQADGTEYDWFGDGKKNVIQGFIDDATGYPCGLYMTKNECLLGYIEAARQMFTNEGLPKAIYPDRAGVFFVNHKSNDGEVHLTQFGLIMQNLGVDMFPAYSPQAKGRIERFWNTIKRRLPNLFMLLGIDTIEKANVFLLKEFPKIYAKWFPVIPKSTETEFVKADIKLINSLLKATFPGHVDKGGIFLFKGYKFFCPELADNKILININEKEGLWVTKTNSEKRYNVKLVETDTTGNMPEVMQILIEKIFLKNAKPKFREVYIDVDEIVLSQVKPHKNTA